MTQWCRDMGEAPRDGETPVSIALDGCTFTVRYGCVWSTRLNKWLGLLPGETPVAWVRLRHPDEPVATLPEGMIR